MPVTHSRPTGCWLCAEREMAWEPAGWGFPSPGGWAMPCNEIAGSELSEKRFAGNATRCPTGSTLSSDRAKELPAMLTPSPTRCLDWRGRSSPNCKGQLRERTRAATPQNTQLSADRHGPIVSARHQSPAGTTLSFYPQLLRVLHRGCQEVRSHSRHAERDWTHLSLPSLASGRVRSAMNDERRLTNKDCGCLKSGWPVCNSSRLQTGFVAAGWRRSRRWAASLPDRTAGCTTSPARRRASQSSFPARRSVPSS